MPSEYSTDRVQGIFTPQLRNASLIPMSFILKALLLHPNTPPFHFYGGNFCAPCIFLVLFMIYSLNIPCDFLILLAVTERACKRKEKTNKKLIPANITLPLRISGWRLLINMFTFALMGSGNVVAAFKSAMGVFGDDVMSVGGQSASPI